MILIQQLQNFKTENQLFCDQIQKFPPKSID